MMDFQLPEGINEADLVPDPHKRAGHWYHEASDQVFACPPDWKPKPKAKGKATEVKQTEQKSAEESGESAPVQE